MPTSGNPTMASRSINVEPPRPSKQKPPRLRSACNQCYAAKVKCTGERAGCARCRTLDAECIYLESRVGKVQGSRSKRRRLELQQQQQQQQPRQQVAVVDQTVERDTIQALGFSADETISQSPQQRRLAPPQPQSQTKPCNTDQQNLFSWNQPWGPPSTAQWPYDDVQILNGTLPSLDDMILNGEAADNNTNSNSCSNDNGHQRLPMDTNPGFELDFMNGDPPSPNMSRSGSSSSSIRSSSSGDSPSRESTPAPSNNGVPDPTLLSPTSTAITTTIMSQPTTATSGENILPTPRSTHSEQPRHQVNQHTATAPRQMPIQHGGVLSVSDNSSTHSPMPRSSASSSSPMSNLGRSRPSQQPQRPNATNNSKLNSRVILASVQILATLENYILADLRALDLILETCRKTLAQMKHLIGLFHAEPWCCPNERCFLLLTAIISQVIQLLRSDVGYPPSSTDGATTTTTATTGDYRDSNRRHGSEDTNNSPSASGVDSDSIFSAVNSSSAFNQLPLFGFGFGGGAFSLTVEEQTLWRSRVMRKEYRRVGEVLSSLRVLLASGGEEGKNKNSEPVLGSLEQELKSLYEMERNRENESIQRQRHEGTKMMSMMNDHGDDDGDGGIGGLLSPFSTVSGSHPLFGS